MKFFRLTLVIIILAAGNLAAQLPVITLEKDFNNSPLTELLQYVATEHGINFFYLNSWTDTVLVIQKSKTALLEDVIRESIAKSQLNYYIDDQRNIIFSHQYKIEPELSAELLNIHREKPKTSRVLDESSFILRGQTSTVADGEGDDRITIGTPGNLSRNSEAVISGFLREKESGQPILGAVVYVNDLGLGTTTDVYGYYVISVPPGNHELLFKYLGRKDAVVRVLVDGNGKLDITLEEQMIELRGVVITADKEQNVKGLQLGLDKLDIQTIKQIPTSLGEVDVIKSTLLLPGVQTVGEGASGFNVRGGNTDQNLILMDGAPLFNSSHMFGFFSVFNPDIVKEFKLYKSGIPAQFGGRLSSVLDVSVRNGNLKKISLSGGISPIAARLSLDGPVIKDKVTFLLSARGSYSDWILRRFDIKALKNSSASFYDVNAKLHYQINENNEISLSTYYSEDHFKLNYDTAYNYRNINGSINYKHSFSKKIYGLFSGIYSNYAYSLESLINRPYAFNIAYLLDYKEARTDFTWFLNTNHKINFGLNAINYSINTGKIRPAGLESLVIPKDLPLENALETGVYASDEFTITNDLAISYGLRYSGFISLGPGKVYSYLPDVPRSLQTRVDSAEYLRNQITNSTGAPEFRFTARYKTGPSSSVKINFAKMNQYLQMLSNTAAISPTDIWKVSGPNLPAQKSWQYSAGYYKDMLSNTLEASLELYYKKSEDILEYRGGTSLLLNPDLEIDLLQGIGKAYGAELLFRKKYGALNGWASYTYSRSLVKVDSKFLMDQINNGSWYPSNYDKPHDFTIVANYRFSRIHSVSSTMTYSTGRPITYPVAKYRFRNRELIHYSNRNQYRVPDYFRWDVSVNIEGNLKAKRLFRDSMSLSVYNLTGRDNVYSIFFVSDVARNVKGYKLSVFARPIVTLTYNIRF